MIKRFFKKKDETKTQDKKSAVKPLVQSFQTPEGQVAYAVGDVHGCYDEMRALLDRIEAHAAVHAPHGYTLVMLGDLMDRGPDSKAVVEYLRSYNPLGAELVFIMGNHEELFLKTLRGDIETMQAWFRFGGKQTVRSYGVRNLGEIEINPQGLIMRIQKAVPREHIKFMESFQDSFVFGNYLFVHAGIKPGVALPEQTSKDMRWIRDRFLSYAKPHPYKVVHGHSIVPEALNLPNRIAVDTGAFKGGSLTAVVLRGEVVDFIRSDDADITA